MTTAGGSSSVLFMLLLLALSGLVSGSETAVFSLRPAERRRLASRRPVVGRLLQRPTSLLVALLLANLFVNVAYFTVSASIGLDLADAGRPGASVAVTAGSLAAIVVAGEVLPKAMALLDPPRLVAALAPFLAGLRLLLLPLVLLGVATTRLVEGLLLGSSDRPRQLSAGDFKSALSDRAVLGTYHAVELSLLHDVVDFGERRARNLMVPRVDVVFLDLSEDRGRWVARMAEHPHADYPVVDGSRDALVGTVNAARLLAEPHSPRSALIEEPVLAPAGIETERLVLRLEQEGRRLAILIDEHGGVVGVVGLAALSQAVLGEIEPPPAPDLDRRPGGAVVARGRCPVRVLERELGLALPIRRAETLGGALAEALGRVPRRGDELVASGWRLRVAGVRGGRVDRVLMRPSGDVPAAAATS